MEVTVPYCNPQPSQENRPPNTDVLGGGAWLPPETFHRDRSGAGRHRLPKRGQGTVVLDRLHPTKSRSDPLAVKLRNVVRCQQSTKSRADPPPAKRRDVGCTTDLEIVIGLPPLSRFGGNATRSSLERAHPASLPRSSVVVKRCRYPSHDSSRSVRQASSRHYDCTGGRGLTRSLRVGPRGVPPIAVVATQTAAVQPSLYSSWRRNHGPLSLRPSGARSSHWYMPQRTSAPRA